MSAVSVTNGNGTTSTPPAGMVAPPHNLEAEQSVLGSILLSDRSLYALVIEEGLRADDFYRERHGTIYEAMLALYNESEPVDVLTVTDRLRQSGKLEDVGGVATVDGLTGVVPAAGHARRYAQIVRENALLRRLLAASYEIQSSVLGHQAAPRELVEQAEKAMLEVARDDRQQDFRAIEEVLHEELDKLHRLSLEGTSLTGTPSGFTDLDEITGGPVISSRSVKPDGVPVSEVCSSESRWSLSISSCRTDSMLRKSCWRSSRATSSIAFSACSTSSRGAAAWLNTCDWIS